jgi:hypothetical protein
LLSFSCLNLSAQLRVFQGTDKQAINDSAFYTDELQIKRNDTIVFYWYSIIGLVKVQKLSHGYTKIECLYDSPILDSQEVISNKMVFCEILLNESINSFEISIDSIAKKENYQFANAYDSLFLDSKNIQMDSLLTLENQFKYVKLVQSLSSGLLNGQLMYFDKLNNFFVDFPFMQFNQLSQEILAYQNLGRVILEYELYGK